jgi:hypothetical protein
VDRYYFYRDIFIGIVSGHQIQWPQGFQLEDPGVEDPVYIQGAVRQGHHSAVSAWGSLTEVSMGPRDCKVENFTD